MRQAYQNLLYDRLIDMKNGLEDGNNEKEGFKESIQELSLYDNHLGDTGSEQFEREKDFALKEDEDRLLSRVEKALTRFKQGKYGKCINCQKEIPLQRLLAIPYAECCMVCEEEDAIHDREERPLEEQVPNIGNLTIYYNQDTMIYDKQDTWQDMLDYGTATDDIYESYRTSDEEPGTREQHELENLPRDDDPLRFKRIRRRWEE